MERNVATGLQLIRPNANIFDRTVEAEPEIYDCSAKLFYRNAENKETEATSGYCAADGLESETFWFNQPQLTNIRVVWKAKYDDNVLVMPDPTTTTKHVTKAEIGVVNSKVTLVTGQYPTQ